MNWQGLFEKLRAQGLGHWAARLEDASSAWLVGHGDYSRWSKALAMLPELSGIVAEFDRAVVTVSGDCEQTGQLRRALQGLMPWRKGPYQLAGVNIDSEWRSDFKWDRIAPQLASLQGRRILDIGCGNGYHCWRMLAQDPMLVLGVEPSVLFNMQFLALQKYIGDARVSLLPIGIEQVPENIEWFDTVFSMGVLYHRRSPIDHLMKLKGLLKPGGELCLETLVIEGGEGEVLLPRDRYARMRNVWFVPSSLELVNWLKRCGFVDPRVIDESVTTTEEQRATEWMQFESLAQCLDPNDPAATVEGLPAPRRAVILAGKTRSN